MSQEIQIDSLPAEFGWDIFPKAWKLCKRHLGNYLALFWGWMIPSFVVNYYVSKISFSPLKMILTLATVGVSAYVSFIMFRVQRKLLASESPVDLIDSVKLAAQNLNRNAILTFWALNAAVQIAQTISEASLLYWLLLLIVNAIAFYYIFLCEVKNLDPIAACKFSLRAVMFNILPMIVFCLSILLWSLASAFTLGMGLIILVPLCNLANLLMANQVFGGANITIVEDSTPAASAASNQA